MIRNYCEKIKAPKELRTIRNTPTGFGDPHIEINESGYHYVIWERGNELHRSSTTDLDELLYLIMKDITFEMASAYELENRIPNQDSRRLLFETQLKNMKKVNIEFYNRLENEIIQILSIYPYDDSE